MKNSLFAVAYVVSGLALGHSLYQYFITDVFSWNRVVELTWFQFNAIIFYWWFTKD